MFQFLPYLAARGMEITCQPFFDDRYVRRIYEKQQRTISSAIAGYARRLRQLLHARRFDLLWVEAELFPWVPYLLESAAAPPIPTVVEYDDAIFHRYDKHQWTFIRRALGTKIDRVMRNASVVIAGNQYIADRARAAGSRRVTIIPTVVDTDRYRSDHLPPGEFTAGWIGTSVTAQYLELLRQPVKLARVGAMMRFRVVGATQGDVPAFVDEVIPWSEEVEANLGRLFTVGVMPLRDSPWERGKCGYKLIQYMANALPVIASSVGVNREVVLDGDTGFIAESERDWLEAFEHLRSDPQLAQKMGAAGRRRVECLYSARNMAPVLYDTLLGAATV